MMKTKPARDEVEFPILPENIYALLGIVFSNSTNRIIANQYPYNTDEKTIYIDNKKHTNDLLQEIEEIDNDTVLIVRDKKGNLVDTYFLPIMLKNKLKSITNESNKIENINDRLPTNFL